MSVTIYEGETIDEVRQAVFGKLKQERIAGVVNKHIVLVPDQFSLTIEKEILDALELKCCFDVEVVSFSRLADKNIVKTGMLNKQTSVLLLRRVIQNSLDKLHYYNKVAMLNGYASEMYAVITNIRNSGVSVKALKGMVDKLSGVVKRKTADIITIYEGYLHALDNYNDMTGILEKLRDSIEDDSNVTSTNYYLIDFYDMAHVKYQIVDKLIDKCKNFVSGIVMSYGRNSKVYNPKLKNRLLNSAGLGENDIVRVDCGLNDEKIIIKDNVFSYGVPPMHNGSEAVESLTVIDRESEVKFCAMRIRSAVVETGLRYRDIAVTVPSIEEYKDTIARVFSQYEIPLYIDDNYVLTGHSAYKVLKYAVSALTYDREYVLSMIKEPCYGLSREDMLKYENHLLERNIDGKKFCMVEDDSEFESIRLRIVGDLNILWFDDSLVMASVAMKNVKTFYNAINIYQTIDAYCQNKEDLSASVSMQVMEKIVNVVDDIIVLFKDEKLMAFEWYDILFCALQTVEIATVPLYIDAVFVGDSNDSRFGKVDTLFMLGVNEGAYPAVSSDKGIVASYECQVWANHGIVVETPKNRNDISKVNLIQLLTKPKKLIMTSLSSQMNALLKVQINRLLNLNVAAINPHVIFGDNGVSIARKLATRANCGDELYREKIKINTEELGIQYNPYNSNDEFAVGVADMAFNNRYVSVSGVENFYTCPYKFFGDKVLKLQERKEAKENSADIGSFMHAVLEIYFRDLYDANHLADSRGMLRDKILEACNIAFDSGQFELLLDSGNTDTVKSILIERAIRIVGELDEKQRKSQFMPKFFEYSFGNNDNQPIQINVAGEEYYIRGYIDRVDIFDNYAIVIDYKSSAKNFTEKELYYGTALQLPIYANAVCSRLGKDLAAMMYVPMSIKYVDEADAKDKNKYEGYVLDNDNILTKIDPNAEDCKATYLPHHAGTDKSSAKKRLSSEQFESVAQYTLAMIVNAVNLVANEPISPTPITHGSKSPCEYCEYGLICCRRNDERITRTMVKSSLDIKNIAKRGEQ